MKHILMIIGLVLVSAGFATAEEHDALTIDGAYAYATTSVQKNGAVFMTIHREDRVEEGKPENYTAPQLFLTKAHTDVAERVELHTHIADGDVMMMREVDGYEIKNNDVLTLEPMGHHIMLFGLKAPLEAGTEFPMTLHFDDENNREITVKVVKPGEMP
ncbi:MAG: copper chaperone PCu(A)C [Alphaproteobacteria bacterium]|nr:copper chaperone PCu(A)C [Alphaproteobacteria bacterium]